MRVRAGILVLSFIALSILSAAPQSDDASQQPETPLVVPAGVPLRLYLTKRAPKRAAAPVQAKVLDPVYAFDRQVIPAGAVVLGTVSRLQPFSSAQRTRAILNGDFTPLRLAHIEFTTLVMPDGRKLPLHTAESLGLTRAFAAAEETEFHRAPEHGRAGNREATGAGRHPGADCAGPEHSGSRARTGQEGEGRGLLVGEAAVPPSVRPPRDTL